MLKDDYHTCERVICTKSWECPCSTGSVVFSAIILMLTYEWKFSYLKIIIIIEVNSLSLKDYIIIKHNK